MKIAVKSDQWRIVSESTTTEGEQINFSNHNLHEPEQG